MYCSLHSQRCGTLTSLHSVSASRNGRHVPFRNQKKKQSLTDRINFLYSVDTPHCYTYTSTYADGYINARTHIRTHSEMCKKPASKKKRPFLSQEKTMEKRKGQAPSLFRCTYTSGVQDSDAHTTCLLTFPEC